MGSIPDVMHRIDRSERLLLARMNQVDDFINNLHMEVKHMSAALDNLTAADAALKAEVAEVAASIKEKMDKTILGIYTKGLGSVEGKLETISERGGLKFIIYDSLSDKPVRCNIGEDLIYEATKAFGKRVYVFGIISYDQYGIPKSIKVSDFKIFEEREKLPSALDVCGILGEANAP